MEGGFLPESPAPRQSSNPAPWPPPQHQQQQPVQPPPTQEQRQRRQPVTGVGGSGSRAPTAGGSWTYQPSDPIELQDEYPESQGGCSRCSSLSFNAEWLRAFGVVLCSQCKRTEALISKSTAKQRYSVTDGDLGKLGSLRKSNPHKQDWQPMHLYMESQVARLAHDKHGGAEGLEQHQQTKLDARLHAKLRRREEEKKKGQQEEHRLLRVRQRLAAEEQQQRQQEAAAASGSEVEEI